MTFHAREKFVDYLLFRFTIRFVIKMDDSVKHLFTVAQDECRKYLTNYKKEVLKVAGGFRHLASAFEVSGQDEGGKNMHKLGLRICVLFELKSQTQKCTKNATKFF